MNNEDKILEKLDKIIELVSKPIYDRDIVKTDNSFWGADLPKSEVEIDIQDMRKKDKKSDDPLKD